MSNPVSRDIAIRARNVTLALGTRAAPVTILKGIDLDIVAGTSVAILGPSGSGKSSLMAILSGLERATAGDVQVAGVSYADLDEAWRGRGGGGSGSCSRRSTCCRR